MKLGKLILSVGLFAFSQATLGASIVQSKHNLSVSGPGTIKASQEDRICVFCHTPHNASPSGPLWNRQDPGFNYIPYTSSTVKAAPGQPTGASMLCLSCHDGTIALGKILSQTTDISMGGGVTVMPTGPTRLGTDLSDDHPISFAYTASLATSDGELVNPATLTGAVKLDATGQLQCTSCHDAHDNVNGNFLVMDHRGGALCTTCHTKNGWDQTPHSTSNSSWDGGGTNPWPFTTWTNVADNACQNCHQSHSAGSDQRLLNYAAEEDNCTACHNGHVAQANILSEFNKFSIHPVGNTTGTHDPTETAVVNTRHVECIDCHNPHMAGSNLGTLPGPLAGVRGISITGTEINPINREYQLCFRCHGNSNNKPAPPTNRLIAQNNVRMEFNTANPSYHPIAGSGANPNVPSLLPPYSTASVIECTDCHNNNTGPNANGSGPNGPHGSIYSTLLERQYVTQDPNAFTSSDYALCFKCHSETSITSNQSGFPHNVHLGVGGMRGGIMGSQVNAPCNTCHDPHGISLTQGNSTNNSKLINFNTDVVFTNSAGLRRYESLGTFSGRCYLSCHDMNHNPCTYGVGGMGGMNCM